MTLDQEVKFAVKQLQGLAKEIGNQRTRKRILRKAALPIVAAAKANVKVADEPVKIYNTKKLSKNIRAPKGQGNVVAVIEPGTLRDAIGIKTFRKSPDVFVGVTGKKKDPNFPFYAAWLEYGATNVDGTRREPKPFMRPAVDSTQGAVGKILIEETAKAVERYAKKVAIK